MKPEKWGERHQFENSEIIRIELGRNNFPLVPGRINATDIKVFFNYRRIALFPRRIKRKQFGLSEGV